MEVQVLSSPPYWEKYEMYKKEILPDGRPRFELQLGSGNRPLILLASGVVVEYIGIAEDSMGLKIGAGVLIASSVIDATRQFLHDRRDIDRFAQEVNEYHDGQTPTPETNS